MNTKDFMELQAGQIIYDRQFNTYGQVKEGDWKNVGILDTKDGKGRYIHWDDGDNSKVGLALHTDQDIAHFELHNDGMPT